MGSTGFLSCSRAAALERQRLQPITKITILGETIGIAGHCHGATTGVRISHVVPTIPNELRQYKCKRNRPVAIIVPAITATLARTKARIATESEYECTLFGGGK